MCGVGRGEEDERLGIVDCRIVGNPKFIVKPRWIIEFQIPSNLLIAESNGCRKLQARGGRQEVSTAGLD